MAVHATFRSPNLKARLGNAREEFRALWCAASVTVPVRHGSDKLLMLT